MAKYIEIFEMQKRRRLENTETCFLIINIDFSNDVSKNEVFVVITKWTM